jgi:predicted nucleic acid-binding protein
MTSEGVIRVFLDTNIIFSGLYSRQGPPGQILDAVVAGHIRAVTAPYALRELARNLARKKPEVRGESEIVLQHFEVRPDPLPDNVDTWMALGLRTDAAIVAAALEAEVGYLCTGDGGILGKSDLLADAGLKVITPRELLTLLEARPDLEL